MDTRSKPVPQRSGADGPGAYDGAMSLDSVCEAAFPRLTEAEMQVGATLGKVRDFADGEVLFRDGEKDFPFFVVQAGAKPPSHARSKNDAARASSFETAPPRAYSIARSLHASAIPASHPC